MSASRLETVYRFMAAYDQNPRITLKKLHREYSPYQTVSATRNLLNEAKNTQVLIGFSSFVLDCC